MKVYELLIDHEMTTRSHKASWGLFASREAVKKEIDRQALEDWQWREIVEREVQE